MPPVDENTPQQGKLLKSPPCQDGNLWGPQTKSCYDKCLHAPGQWNTRLPRCSRGLLTSSRNCITFFLALHRFWDNNWTYNSLRIPLPDKYLHSNFLLSWSKSRWIWRVYCVCSKQTPGPRFACCPLLENYYSWIRNGSDSFSQNSAVFSEDRLRFHQGDFPPLKPSPFLLSQLESLAGFGPSGITAVGNRTRIS